MQYIDQHSEEYIDKEEIINENFQNAADLDFVILEKPSTLQI